ncbi:MAG: PQQ-dependent sugar dehydrogenase [Acidimicrobiia bacterium]
MGSSTTSSSRPQGSSGRSAGPGRLRRTAVLGAALAVLALGLTACFPPAEQGAPILAKVVYVGGLSRPWDLAFLPDGTPLYTENDSGLISVRLDGDPHHVLRSVYDFDSSFDPSGEGGLMGIAVDPNWSVNQFVYACYSTATDNRVVRMTLNPAANPPIANWTPIVTNIPHAGYHNGCRVRFRPGSTDELFVSTGDAATAKAPQDDNSLGGKILRIQTPGGNAYPGNASGKLWYTKGHRNPQGIAFRPGTNQVFDDEHGPNVEDELNLLANGGNAGWNPIDTNIPPNYFQGVPMTGPLATISPTWNSGGLTVAPSGSTFLSGAKWKNWDGAFVVGTLDADPNVGQRLLVMHLNPAGTQLTSAPVPALALGVRLRAAVQGPDGNLYVVTDGDGGTGEIWKVAPI